MGARARKFLDDLAAGGSAARTLVVVAHPDDETIGIGGNLPHLANATILHLTQGAPSDPSDARRAGLSTQQEYAAARRAELEAALALAGLSPAQAIGLGIVDQEAVYALVPLARKLVRMFAERQTEIVLTHPYEGGHPDHDAACFAVHAAARLSGPSAPAVVEMAFYHDDGAGLATQRFLPDRAVGEVCLMLAGRDWARKRRMIACFATQQAVLVPFDSRAERLRPAPLYDFGRPPNRGRIYYERLGWPIRGAVWSDRATAALHELALDPRL